MENASIKAKSLSRSTAVSLFCRFIVLFFAACLLGIYIENKTGYSNDYGIIRRYFLSFHCESFMDFIKNVCQSSSFEFFVLLAALGSAFTFFCSAFLHISCVVCGIIYGICIYGLTNEALQDQSVSAWLYIASVAAFAIIFSVGASFALDANKRFISTKRSNTSLPRVFVSPILKQYLIGCLKLIALFVFVHILYVGALSIVQINN